VTTGFFANAGNGIEPAQANGNRAHDAAHPVAVLTSPPLSFRNSSMGSTVVEIDWEGGAGNQNGSPDPADLAAVMNYNGGTTNNAGQKGLGFRNLVTGEYDFVSYDSGNGGGVETLVYTRSDLVSNGIDINASYELDFFTTDDGGWGWTRLNQLRVDAILNPGPSSVPQLRITQSGGNLSFEWDSQAGMLYNLRSDADLQPEPALWPIHGTNENIEATPPLNTLTIPLPAANELFFVIEGFPKPPVVIFEDNFDDRNDLAPWTNSSPDGNAWALGVPTAPLGPTAFSRPNVVGTVLAGDYIASGAVGTYVVSTLRSPAMDLSGIVSGTISYQRFVDMEDPIFDKATVNLLDASDFLLIEVLENDIGNVSVNWEGVSHDIPAAAIGKSVIFEIVFSADEFDTFQTGLVIDDFKVEGVEP
jgi:hypothetical protein